MSRHHIGAKKRIESGLAVLGGQFEGKLELGEISKLSGPGLGTPAGCYPLKVTLDGTYGSPEYYREMGDAAAAMRNIGWKEVGNPDPEGPNVIFNVGPDVVQHILDAGIRLKAQEHFTPSAAQAASRA
jgi:hypothetical protein